jgi:hypothetical protein
VVVNARTMPIAGRDWPVRQLSHEQIVALIEDQKLHTHIADDEAVAHMGRLLFGDEFACAQDDAVVQLIVLEIARQIRTDTDESFYEALLAATVGGHA